MSSSLIIGKCISTAKKNTIRLLIPQLKFDSFLNKHFRENETILAHDQDNVCNPGDWVLLRKFDERFRLDIDYRVEKIVYESGNIIDPLTGKKTLDYENVDDYQRLSKMFNK
ncbi:mitochondrial ribosomal protein S17 [Dermatophagoides farinae]|uniref:37S ribosomal protein S17 mitochondrial n=1 Tax=Dermatophagoides farinae TaxID=6954 RepID=A0A922ID08_DERFA|nr:30S ribosomal protein S17-like [Dermatophagoides farinae]KAH7641307.1 hypothetical protein HUG17_4351 [Dermatophagoides farinae]KAH9527069.1 37S ribosomal protein S17 mitochondrial [Dermatophagoides farinae]